MDKITLHELKVEAIIGVYAWERQVKQPLIVTLSVAVDNRRVAVANALDQALNYAVLAEKVGEFISQTQFELLEVLVEETANFILTEFASDWVCVQITKPSALLNAKGVSILIERQR